MSIYWQRKVGCMARKVVVEWVDDLDGGEAEATVTFGLDGVVYEIDLSEENAAELREELAPFVAAARRVGRSPGSRNRRVRARANGSGTSVDRATRAENKQVRDWAAHNGFELAERGRIPEAVRDAYRRAN